MAEKITYSESNAAALNAGIAAVLNMDDTLKKVCVPPYNHFILTNHSVSCTLQVLVNGGVANNVLIGHAEGFFIPPESVLEIEPKDGILFEHIAIKNTHTTDNIAIGEIEWTMKSF